MSEHYFFTHDGAERGPFSAAQMRGLAAAGQIVPTDSVWKEGKGQRVSAAKVGNLFAGHPPAPAPGLSAPMDRHQLPGEPAAAEQSLAKPEALSASPADVVGSADELPRPPSQPTPVARAGSRTAQQNPVRKKRVVGIKGAVLLSQDGTDARFTKKCGVCGYEDTSRSKAKIMSGTVRQTFFCPKCRSSRTVEIMGAG